MVKNKLAISALLALALCLPAAAADYYFKVNNLKATLTVQPDSMVEIRYAITFSPEPGSLPIDIVDIGMPNENYDLGTARASIAGIESDRHPKIGIRQARRRSPPGWQHDLSRPDRHTGIQHHDQADDLSRQRRQELTLHCSSRPPGTTASTCQATPSGSRSCSTCRPAPHPKR